MSSKPPRLPENPLAAFDYEVAQEKASALGRMGRRLEATLAALTAFDARHPDRGALDEDDRTERRALVAEAGVALWHFIVQRESLGLRDSARVLRDYRVPDEVRDRTGAFPAVQLRPRKPIRG
jgi:hypothetical protein